MKGRKFPPWKPVLCYWVCLKRHLCFCLLVVMPNKKKCMWSQRGLKKPNCWIWCVVIFLKLCGDSQRNLFRLINLLFCLKKIVLPNVKYWIWFIKFKRSFKFSLTSIFNDGNKESLLYINISKHMSIPTTSAGQTLNYLIWHHLSKKNILRPNVTDDNEKCRGQFNLPQ